MGGRKMIDCLPGSLRLAALSSLCSQRRKKKKKKDKIIIKMTNTQPNALKRRESIPYGEYTLWVLCLSLNENLYAGATRGRRPGKSTPHRIFVSRPAAGDAANRFDHLLTRVKVRTFIP